MLMHSDMGLQVMYYDVRQHKHIYTQFLHSAI